MRLRLSHKPMSCPTSVTDCKLPPDPIALSGNIGNDIQGSRYQDLGVCRTICGGPHLCKTFQLLLPKVLTDLMVAWSCVCTRRRAQRSTRQYHICTPKQFHRAPPFRLIFVAAFLLR